MERSIMLWKKEIHELNHHIFNSKRLNYQRVELESFQMCVFQRWWKTQSDHQQGCLSDHISTGIYPLVNKQFAIENGPLEIVDLPINSMVIFHLFLGLFTRSDSSLFPERSCAQNPSLLPHSQVASLVRQVKRLGEPSPVVMVGETFFASVLAFTRPGKHTKNDGKSPCY